MSLRRLRSIPLAAMVAWVILSSGTAQAGEFDEFGITGVGAELSTSVAGAHPDVVTDIEFNHFFDGEGKPQSAARLKDLSLFLPPGLIGNPTVVQQCATGSFEAFANCPVDSQVGVVETLVAGFSEFTEPLYRLQPPHELDEIARFGFYGGVFPVFIDISVRTGADYGVTATVRDATGLAPLLSARTTLWGIPASPVHDAQRLTAKESINCTTACEAPEGKRSSGLPERPFMSNPSTCQEMKTEFRATSYQLPGEIFGASAPMGAITDCAGLPFESSLELNPTTRRAGAPTGLHATLRIPQHEDGERATSTLREARVTLPEGMTISASAAQGLEGCSDEQVGLHKEIRAACPERSKLGTAAIVSPALTAPLHGTIFQRTPSPGHQFGLWLVSDDLGLHLKLPGEVVGNPTTGQLTARFADLPQLPVEEVTLNFFGGPRAPLKNPDDCGTHAASFDLDPWSEDPHATGSAHVIIDDHCGSDLSPRLQGGATNPLAGAFSPFVLTLTREDGESNIRDVEVELPQGLLAKLKGVPLCPDPAAVSGVCPADSKIGSVAVAVGAGPEPLWLPQPDERDNAIYLAGPYQSAPYSIVSVVPAKAGPFDLGTVAVRSALDVDSETGVASVRTKLPQVLEGATVLYRTINVAIDRERFTLNPTDCSEMAVAATVTALNGMRARPTARFQLGGCKLLKFKPKLSMRLNGGTDRGDYPALTATLRTRKRDANLARTVVSLPHSEFLAQEHIGTICTRSRFAAESCPERSVYGYAKAWTPLLSKPLAGPVYLRSSDHPLPDLVAALDGQIDIDLVGQIDSHKGGIRTTFASVPDAPVTRFVIRMKGGKKGLLVNSTDICTRAHRAVVAMHAQNGRALVRRPVLSTPCRHR